MRNKILFYIICFIGIVSIFFPYYKSIIFACGFGPCYKDYQYINFLEMYYDNFQFFKPQFLNFIDVFILTLIIISILFYALLYFLKKYLAIIILTVICLIYFLFSLVNAFDILQYGFYILLFQQIILLFLVLKVRFFN